MLLTWVLGGVVFESPAEAEQTYGPDVDDWPVILNQQRTRRNKLQVGLLFSRTLLAKYTESTGVSVHVQYNFLEQLGVELNGATYLSGENALMEAIRVQVDQEPGLSDMHQMQWLASGSVVWSPIYGRLSLAGAWEPTFDLYLLLGAGVVGTARKFDSTNDLKSISATGHIGAGTRLYLWKNFAMRLDIRSVHFPDPGSERPGQDVSGWTSSLVGQLGLQVDFGFSAEGVPQK